jgi:putative membrane-bound dehydrogenase-like protein
VKTLTEWHPRIRHILGVDYATSEAVTLRFREFDGVARTSGATIEASARYFAKHPDDVGALLHELVHVVQAYPPGAPGWLVEGIADYVRYYYFEPAKGAAFRAQPRQSYKGGYLPAAALLASAQVGKPKAIVAELNRLGHAGKLSEAAFKDIVGQAPDEVWKRVPGNKSTAATAPQPGAKRDISYNAVQGTPKTAAEQQKLFHLPEGFEIELVVKESEGIGKFVSVYFDQRGRMWTQTALEYPVDGNENPAAAEALYKSPGKDKVLVYPRESLNAAIPAGGLTNPTVFADGLAIPLGILPWGNGDTCYIQHGPDLKLFKDTNGDGKADTSKVILTGFGVQDSHLFPHQFTRAPGGWIWMAQGLFNNSKVHQPGGDEIVDWPKCSMAKMRPDGSEFEVTSTGPNNIWGLVITGEGEAFIQEANDYGYPVMPFHEYAYYPGGMEGLKKSYQPDFPHTADFRMGGTGLSGLALGEGVFRKLTPTVKDDGLCMFVANPIISKVQTIAMHRDTAYWKLEQAPDLITCDDPFFRPVGMTNGPDGCIYIVDWYNKIISHNEVPRSHPDRDKTRGRIWRVKAKVQKPVEIPNFTKLNADELIAKLGGEPLAQHHFAWQAIGDRGMTSYSYSNANNAKTQQRLWNMLEQKDPPLTSGQMLGVLWALEEGRIYENDYLGWESRFFPLLESGNHNLQREGVRALAKRLAYLNGHGEFSDDLLELGKKPGTEPDVRAMVIRVFGKTEALAGLLSLTGPPLAAPIAPSSRNGKPIKVREAYDREFERFLVRMFLERQPDAVAKFLDSDDAKKLPVEARLLASLALGPKASAARVAMLLPQLERAPGQEEVLRLAQFPDEPGVGDALRAILSDPKTGAASLESLLAMKTRLDAKKLAPFLTDAASALLASKDAAGVELGIKLAGAFRLASVEDALVSLLKWGAHAPSRAVAGASPETLDVVVRSPEEGSTKPTPSTIGASGGAPDAAREARALPIALAALRALSEIGSTRSDIFADLADKSSDPLLRDEALATLATSKAADAPARVFALYPNLAPAQRRSALESLSATKPGARAIVEALNAGTLAAGDVDAPLLDRLQAVLGPDDATLAKLVDKLGALFRPVLALDGSDEAWTQTDATLDGPCTIEAWVRLDPQGRKIGNADGIAGAPGQLDFNFYGERARIYAFPPLGDVVVARNPITPGIWTHVAATRDAAGIWKLYIDGELDAAGTKPAVQKIENLRIGWTSAKGGPRGALSEVRLWNRERTAEEIRAMSDRTVAADGRRQADPIRNPQSAIRNPNSPPPSVGGCEGLVFSSASDNWGTPQKGAKVIRSIDFPPILSADEAAALDAKYAKFRSLAEKPGDAVRGKAAALVCSACHVFGTTGGNIGPNLSGVGAMGTEAILRNLLQPNAAMEAGYRIYRVELKNGDVLDAMFVSEDKDALVVRMPGADDRRIPKGEVRSAKFLRRSLMPEGLLDAMTPEQVSDLFAYLMTLK